MTPPSSVAEPLARARRTVEEVEAVASGVLLPLAAGGVAAAVEVRRAARTAEELAQEVRGRARVLRAARAAAWRSRAAELYRLRLDALAHEVDVDAAALSALAAALRRHAAQVEVRAAALQDAAGSALALGAHVLGRGAELVRAGGPARAVSAAADEVAALAAAGERALREVVPIGAASSVAAVRDGSVR
ncbi:hypothetical protein WDZ17_02075 [Pseudokineococcus basanitobsidens]|uniref:Uncharacterized protein n=1 Tax=Pseudokineococcus basanitobsidens TaxID=1926649 RepID=A0ABU8RGE2_9ACTN